MWRNSSSGLRTTQISYRPLFYTRERYVHQGQISHSRSHCLYVMQGGFYLPNWLMMDWSLHLLVLARTLNIPVQNSIHKISTRPDLATYHLNRHVQDQILPRHVCNKLDKKKPHTGPLTFTCILRCLHASFVGYLYLWLEYKICSFKD